MVSLLLETNWKRTEKTTPIIEVRGFSGCWKYFPVASVVRLCFTSIFGIVKVILMNKVFCGKQTNKPEKQGASTSGPPPLILRLDLPWKFNVEVNWKSLTLWWGSNIWERTKTREKCGKKSCGKCEIGNRSGGENTARPFAKCIFPSGK